MSRTAGLFYKIRLLTNLGILIWISILNTLSRAIRNGLARLLLRVAPSVRAETGLLVNTYELMRERLKDSSQEIELHILTSLILWQFLLPFDPAYKIEAMERMKTFKYPNVSKLTTESLTGESGGPEAVTTCL